MLSIGTGNALGRLGGETIAAALAAKPGEATPQAVNNGAANPGATELEIKAKCVLLSM